MALRLNRMASVCEAIAKSVGKISEGSSSRAFIYELSRQWRMLCEASRDCGTGQRWSQREKILAMVVIVAVGCLHFTGCRDIESLIKDCISESAPTG